VDEGVRIVQKPFDPEALLATVREVLDEQKFCGANDMHDLGKNAQHNCSLSTTSRLSGILLSRWLCDEGYSCATAGSAVAAWAYCKNSPLTLLPSTSQCPEVRDSIYWTKSDKRCPTPLLSC